MRSLVVLEAKRTESFVEELRRAWDAGDAVFPLDPRLPKPAQQQLLAVARIDAPVEDGDALVVATSGTAGEPKAAVLTHSAITASAEATSERLGVDPQRDRWLACLPLAHIGGLSVVTRALLTDTALTLTEDNDATILQRAAAAGCTLVSLVPAMLDRVDRTDVWAFRTILLGGSAMPPALPANAVTTYGMTETGSGIAYDGKPLTGVEVRVVEDEIQLRAPMLLRCYRDGTDPRLPDGWFPTGDGGSWDPATATVTVTGRLTDVIITGGEKVWPTTVERVLATHPAVSQVLVFGRDDPRWGQRVVARIVPSDGPQLPSLVELRDLVGATLPAWAAPRELELASTLPRTASGKVARRPAP